MALRQRASTDDLPTLEAGDHLSPEEFARVYEQRPDIKKAELIGGVVYVPSPVRIDLHAEPHSIIVGWADRYLDDHPELRTADNGSFHPANGGDEVQPDVVIWDPNSGRAFVGERNHLYGAPELVIEIAASSASYDLHVKKESYRRAGVAEYLVWRVVDGAVDWFRLEGGEYVPLRPDSQGRIESKVFPGLRLHVPNLLEGKRGRALWE